MAMPVLDGLAATRTIAKEIPKVRVLILTMHANSQLVHELLEAGARGYVMKSDAARDLIGAIGTLLEDKRSLPKPFPRFCLTGSLRSRSICVRKTS
jgi:DNA-binding NarL/FixJ family response regulator